MAKTTKVAGKKAVAKKPPLKKRAANKPTSVATPPLPPRRSSSLAWTNEQQRLFLGHLAETANVRRSSDAAGKSTSAAYALRKRDPAFAQKWADALEQALDLLEAHIIERAGEGVTKDYFYQGESRGLFKEHSNDLAMFMLRARRPEIYGKNNMQTENMPPLTARAKAVKEILLARIRTLHDGKTPVETQAQPPLKPNVDKSKP
jgi:hypothetical protein